MTAMTCKHCGATTTNGLALCELGQRKVTLDLEFVPVYFRNLARWKPGRAGSRPVPGSRIPAGALGSGAGEDKVIRALDEANNALVTWARMLADDRGWALPRPLEPFAALLLGEMGDLDLTHAETVTVLCHGFERHLTSVATTEWAGEFVRGIGQHEEQLRELTERVAPGWYAGACRRCEEPTHVVPGLTWVTCVGCGATTYARDHLDTVLSEARGWVASPKRMAERLVALLDSESSVDDLRKRIAIWGARGHIEVVRATGFSEKCYRLGDVLDQLAARSRVA